MWPVLLFVGILWEFFTLFLYHGANTKYSSWGLNCGAFCALKIMPPLGWKKWEAAIHDSDGIGWAFADPYRVLIGEFFGIFILTSLEFLSLILAHIAEGSHVAWLEELGFLRNSD